MPRESDGTFRRFNSQYYGTDVWQQDLETDKKIIALRHDVHDEDLAQGIAACLPKDGAEQMLGTLNMGNFGIKNLKDAQNLEYHNAVAFGQVIHSVSFDDTSRRLTLMRENMIDLVVTIPSGGDHTIIKNGIQFLHAGTGIEFLSGQNVMSEANEDDTILLSNTGVLAGSYRHANITIDAKGRISQASDGLDNASIVLTPSTSSVDIEVSGAHAPMLAAIPDGEQDARAGVLTSEQAKRFEDAAAGVVTDLAIGTHDRNQMWVDSSSGANVNLPVATTLLSGIINSDMFDKIEAAGAGSTPQTLSNQQLAKDFHTITISNGNTVSIIPATIGHAGCLSANQLRQFAGLDVDGDGNTKAMHLENDPTSSGSRTLFDHTGNEVTLHTWGEHIGIPLGGDFVGSITATEPTSTSGKADKHVWFVY